MLKWIDINQAKFIFFLMIIVFLKDYNRKYKMATKELFTKRKTKHTNIIKKLGEKLSSREAISI